MAITKNQIYTNIVNAVQDVYPTAYCAGRLEPVPQSFPAVYIRQIGYYIPSETYDLGFIGYLERPTFEIQVYSNKENDAGQEAYGVMSVVSDIMLAMGFLCDAVEEIDNIEPTIFRLVGRWHRLIGQGESMDDYEPTP